MSIALGFTIVLMLLLIIYMTWRLYLRRKIVVFVSLTVQLCIFTIAAVSFLNNVKTTESIEGLYVIFGIVIPGAFFVYDYAHMITKVRKSGVYRGLIEPAPRIFSKKTRINFNEIKNNINPILEEVHPSELIVSVDLIDEDLKKNLKKTAAEAQMLIESRNLKDASRIYSTLTGLFRDSAALYYNYANICYMNCCYIEAINNYQKAIKANKKHIEKNSFEKLQTDERLSEIKNSSVKSNSSPNDISFMIFYNLGNALFKLEKYQQAIEAYNKALEAKPDLKEARENAARALICLGSFNEAIEYCKSALEKDRTSYLNHYILARVYYELNNIDGALSSINECIALKPAFEEGYVMLGQLLASSGRNEEAIQVYEKLTKINPENHMNYYNLGTSYYRMGQMDKAAEAFKISVKINPGCYRSYFNMAAALEELQQKDGALMMYRKAIALKPDFVEAYNNLGILLSKIRKYREAVDIFKKGIEINPKEHSLYFNLGVTLSEMNRYSDAAEAFKRALELKPDEHLIYYHLGVALTELKKYNEALDYYKKALKFMCSDSEIFYNIACVYSLLKKYDIAIDNLKKALELNAGLKIDARFNRAFEGIKSRQEFRELIS